MENMSFEQNAKMYLAKAKEYTKTYWYVLVGIGIYFLWKKYGNKNSW